MSDSIQTVDAGEVPENLYLTAALLIWHGFVKLSDLWNHVSELISTQCRHLKLIKGEGHVSISSYHRVTQI